MVIAYLVDAVWSFVAMRRSWSTPIRSIWPLRGMLAVGVAFAAGFGAARGVDSALDGLAGTLLALAAGTLAYPAAGWLAGFPVDRDRERIASARRSMAVARASR